jgi:dolichol-phosphate mannosyltransferase
MTTESPSPRILVAIPIYNESAYIDTVLSEVAQYASHVLVIDDGSTDATPAHLARHRVEVIRHAENRGYGRSMQDMFRWATIDRFDWLITMDCDEQHEPSAIPTFIDRINRDEADIISGSRYMQSCPLDDAPPEDRRRINQLLTREINDRLHLQLTDSFCGFKAYRVAALKNLVLDVDGYEFPMQFWVQAVAHRLRIEELPVRLIYNDPTRSFGGPLDDKDNRLMIYRETFELECERCSALIPAVPAAL